MSKKRASEEPTVQDLTRRIDRLEDRLGQLAVFQFFGMAERIEDKSGPLSLKQIKALATMLGFDWEKTSASHLSKALRWIIVWLEEETK